MRGVRLLVALILLVTVLSSTTTGSSSPPAASSDSSSKASMERDEKGTVKPRSTHASGSGGPIVATAVKTGPKHGSGGTERPTAPGNRALTDGGSVFSWDEETETLYEYRIAGGLERLRIVGKLPETPPAQIMDAFRVDLGLAPLSGRGRISTSDRGERGNQSGTLLESLAEWFSGTELDTNVRYFTEAMARQDSLAGALVRAKREEGHVDEDLDAVAGQQALVTARRKELNDYKSSSAWREYPVVAELVQAELVRLDEVGNELDTLEKHLEAQLRELKEWIAANEATPLLHYDKVVHVYTRDELLSSVPSGEDQGEGFGMSLFNDVWAMFGSVGGEERKG